MRKTSALRNALNRPRDKPDETKEKHGRGRPRAHWLVLFLLLASPVVRGQDLEVHSESRPASNPGREQRALREQWFLRGRSSPGQSGAAQRYRAHLQKMRMRAARLANAQRAGLALSPSSNVVWSPLGPAPLASDASGTGEYDYGWVSGRATAVAVDPADRTGNTVYIGGAYGGVWKSTNAACGSFGNASCVAWAPLTDNQATLAIGAIAIQPGGTGVVLAGTGEANSSADSYYGLGILRSSDAGTTWKLISSDTTGTRSFAGMGFSKVAFSSNAPNLAVAATAGTPEGIIEGMEDPLTANLGIYYSTDSGLSWTFANVSDGGATTAPGSASSVVYNAAAGASQCNNVPGIFFAALRYHGFYSSCDGANWTRLATQPGGGLSATACPANPSSSSCPIYRGEIAVVPGRKEMYVWYVDANDFDQGIYETTDGGGTWIQIDDAGIINCGDELGCGTQDGTYNLELAAVPNGGATDLYAGAINLYKCGITVDNPTCSSNNFLNLTHAYGCSSIAKVHPAQHAVSFALVNGNNQDVMYFANDGGIYRAVDGYTGLTTGACGGINQFDSLNMTLGSMTQFVSFAQASGDDNTILGGTQGNGSPGTQSAQATSPRWLNVNFGDGGYTQISPNDELLWFVSNPPDSISGVNIFSCASGIDCQTQDFQNHPVVSSATVGGDTGAYYPPYILDPHPLTFIPLIVGTCRMWRGPSAGGSFSVLSHSFETGGDGICSGGEINLVRSLAVGGALDNTGYSTVMYAGTDGFGPLVPTTPPGGHVWVSGNVANGLSSWVDQTGSINPNSFPISGIAIDRSDPLGTTAYVSIMGFGSASFPTSHVWQTTNGGSSWTDFTANLPNAPVNAVLVDPGPDTAHGALYVGTDVGVFSTSTGNALWTEVGPLPGNDPGYLPNVAVTALRIFTESGGGKWLRASTYGRGIWEFPLVIVPDFYLSVSDTPQTVYAGQLPAVFNGNAFAVDGYNLPVLLTCAAGATQPPRTCSLPSNKVTPTASGTPFQLSASDATQDYSFAVQGTDTNNLMRQAPVTLNVVDFDLTLPLPGSVKVGSGSSSPPVNFQVTAAGSFQDTVNLSCVVPQQLSGISCKFQPSGTVNPTAGNPSGVTLTLTAAANQMAATGTIIIEGAVANGYNKTQNLTVTAFPDYTLAISNPALQAVMAPGGTARVDYKGTLTSLSGYTSEVSLRCGAGATPAPPKECSASPTPQAPTANGAPFTVDVASNQCSPPNTPPHTPYSFNIVAQGTDSSKISQNFPVTFTVTSPSQDDFTLEVTPPLSTAPVNTPVQFNGNLMGTVCYNYPVHLSCGSNAPPTCQFSPATIAPSVGGAQFTLTVGSDKAATYDFEVAAVGSDPNATTHSYPVTFTSTGSGVGSGFSFTITPPSSLQSLPAGQPAIYVLDVVPSGGPFPSIVTLAFSDNCPPLSTCTLSPTQVSKGSTGKTQITFTITTTAPVIADRRLFGRSIDALWLLLPGLIVSFGGLRQSRTQRKRIVFFCVLAIMVAALWLEIACGSGLQGNGSGGNGQAGTPPGSYMMTVTATVSGLPQQTAQVELTVN